MRYECLWTIRDQELEVALCSPTNKTSWRGWSQLQITPKGTNKFGLTESYIYTSISQAQLNPYIETINTKVQFTWEQSLKEPEIW